MEMKQDGDLNPEEEIKSYFPDNVWSNMVDYERKAYINMLHNYNEMKSLNMEPKKPLFMTLHQKASKRKTITDPCPILEKKSKLGEEKSLSDGKELKEQRQKENLKKTKQEEDKQISGHQKKSRVLIDSNYKWQAVIKHCVFSTVFKVYKKYHGIIKGHFLQKRKTPKVSKKYMKKNEGLNMEKCVSEVNNGQVVKFEKKKSDRNSVVATNDGTKTSLDKKKISTDVKNDGQGIKPSSKFAVPLRKPVCRSVQTMTVAEGCSPCDSGLVFVNAKTCKKLTVAFPDPVPLTQRQRKTMKKINKKKMENCSSVQTQTVLENSTIEQANLVCDKCSVTYPSPLHLVLHEKRCRGEKTATIVEAAREPDLQTLAVVVDSKRTLRCNLGSCETTHRNTIKRHFTTHNEERPHVCDVCRKGFERADYLAMHKRKHTGENLYKCDQCPYASAHKNDLKRHVISHIGEKPYNCDQCPYASAHKYNLKQHMIRHTGEKPYKCDQCPYASAHKKDLKQHMIKHTGEKLYKCDQCPYVSDNRNNMKQHIIRHTGEKPFKCDQCPYASAHKYNLKRHVIIHIGEKPYKCDQCPYASAHKYKLKQHMIRHTGEKPYKCDQCPYASAHNNDLKQHMIRHTGEKPYKCDQCPYASAHNNDLKRHMIRHTTEKLYCDQCPYASGIRGNLKRHTMIRHTGKKTIQL